MDVMQTRTSHARPEIMPEYLAPNLRAVFCFTVLATPELELARICSLDSDDFWNLLFESGLTTERLTPEEDWRLLEFGFGAVNLLKRREPLPDANGWYEVYEVDELVAKIKRYRPAWLATVGKEAAGAYLRSRGKPGWVRYGLQAWKIDKTSVFVLPHTCAENLRNDYEGRPSRLSLFREFAQILQENATDLHIGR